MPDPAGAAPAQLVSVSQVNNDEVITTDLRHWNKTDFEVRISNGPVSNLKVEVEVFRSGDDPNNDFPYWQRVVADVSYSFVSNVVVQAPPNSFQSGSSFQWRARWWRDGDGGNPSAWSVLSTFSTKAATGRPGSPFPLSPTGPIAPLDNILRFELTRAGQSLLVDPIVEYKVELRLSDSTVTFWSSVVAAPASPTAILEVDAPVLPSDTRFRWRAFARTATAAGDGSAGSSSPSRWRYFRTTGPQYQEEFWYVPDRAGSYQAGDTGDEVSAMVASRQYPGVYWMIRDNGPGDRARLYAIKIDPATGQLANIDGYATKEIDLVGAENLDWEGITLDANNNLWIADSGSYWDGGFQTRTEGLLHRVPEPDPYTAVTATINKTAPYTFPPGVQFRNVEAIFTIYNTMFLIAKEEPQLVFQLPSYLSTNGNQLTNLGPLAAKLDNITGVAISDDMARLAITTTPKRLYVWENPNGAQPTPTSGAGARAIMEQFIDRDPDWHYYYRSAGALEADGLLYTRDGSSQQGRQTGMQTEGVAFATTGNYELAMVSEFGSHVMFVPPSSYEVRQGAGGFSGESPPNVDPSLLGDRLVPRSSWWYYDDDGATAANWNQVGGDLSDYRIGTAQLGYGEGDEATVTNRDGHITDYFVRPFSADPEDVWALDLAMLVDDGAVVYINGTEVARFNMFSGTVTPNTKAKGAWGTAETTPYFKQLSPLDIAGLLNPGVNANVLAVEVHQNLSGSSDLTFDLELTNGIPFQPTQLDGRAVFLGTDRLVDLTWQTSASEGDGIQEIWHRDPTNNEDEFRLVRTVGPGVTSVRVDVADNETWAGEFAVLATSAQTAGEWCGPDDAGCERPKVSFVTEVAQVVSAKPDALPFSNAATPAVNVSRSWEVPVASTATLERLAQTSASKSGTAVTKVTKLGKFGIKRLGFVATIGFALFVDAQELGGSGLLIENSVVTRTTDWNDLEEWAALYPAQVAKTAVFVQVITLAPPADTAEQQALKAQIDRACQAAANKGRTCEDDGMAFYFPGGANFTGNKLMPETGLHIYHTLVTEPATMGVNAPAVQGNWWMLTRQKPSPQSQWYDTNPWKPNECEFRATDTICDEFPFKSTNEWKDSTNVRASLLPVPEKEGPIQGNDLLNFYNQCGVANQDDPFIVISPPASYLQNQGPSFGVRISIPAGRPVYERCLGQ